MRSSLFRFWIQIIDEQRMIYLYFSIFSRKPAPEGVSMKIKWKFLRTFFK